MSSKSSISEPQKTASRPRGRPQGYDDREALDTAMRLFWAHGYEGASVDMLCRETGMPRASLYQRFGDKEGLFLATIEHYVETRIRSVTDQLAAPQLGAALAGFFDAVAALATDDPEARGCLVSCVLADAAGSNLRFRTELARRYSRMEARLTERLAEAREQGELGPETDPAALAGVLAAVARGIVLRARAGATRAELQVVARTAAALVPYSPLAA